MREEGRREEGVREKGRREGGRGRWEGVRKKGRESREETIHISVHCNVYMHIQIT